MLFQFGFQSSILLITFSNGLVYSFLLLLKGFKTEKKSNYWLSFFVFLCSLYVAPWMLGFAGWYNNQPYRDFLFYVPFQQVLLIGPVIFYYTQSLLNQNFLFNKRQFLHLIPGIIYLLYSISMWIYDKFVFNDYYFYEDGIDKDFDNWYQKLGLISMIIYFLLSIRYYNIYKKLVFQVVSYANTILFKWIKNYLIAFLIMLLLPIVFDFFTIFYPKLNSYIGSWWFFLSFSVVTYYIALTGYSNPINSSISFYIMESNSNQILLLSNTIDAEQESIIDIDFETHTQNDFEKDSIWRNKIKNVIEENKLFINPELTLSDVAKKLETNVSVISKTINQNFKMNFNDFINNYRVESVKEAFENGEHKKSTLSGIAFNCGFNSKATFNRAFKKSTGYSPKEYIKKNNPII